METIICVVGLGYVGLPLAVTFSKVGFRVIGFDVNESRISELKNNFDNSEEVSKEQLSSVKIEFTNDPLQIKKANFVIACVPTPVTKHKKPDLKYCESASQVIGKNLQKGSIVVFESTVYPGVTEDVCLPIIEKESGLKCPQDFKIGYSPERINPGDKEHTVDKITKIVSGIDAEALDKIANVYSKMTSGGVFRATSIKTAEAAKVIENIQRDLNIALINELSMIFNKMNIKTKDVLDAAYTKWNFHRYTPGLVGGHCFEKNSTVFLMDDNTFKVKKIGNYIDSLKCKKIVSKGSEIFSPKNLKILSYDLVKHQTSFKPVTLASRRPADNILRINCSYNYKLDVTDLHPVIYYDGKLKVKFAKDIKPGDRLVLNKSLTCAQKTVSIDLLDHLNKKDFGKIRVKLKNGSFSDFKQVISKNLNGKKANYYNHDYLPLKKYLELEKNLAIRRNDIFLCTGRGPSFKKVSCVWNFDQDFFRLIGYYLSEGCITKDESLRTRFTFNRNEKEYINDVKTILTKFGLDYSVYDDKQFQATTIKVSSYLFGFLLKDILKCGTDCYSMQIPQLFFDLKKEFKEEMLKGLFRGDGGVTWYSKDRTYKKNHKEFVHANNSVVVSYFSSSPVLFQQVMLFLLSIDILPKLAKRNGYLTITGINDVKKVKGWFLGEKRKKVNDYLNNSQKEIVYNKAKHFKSFITVAVEKIELIKTDYVYSMEVEDTHTLITSNGLIAHNCIGVDPYYLTYKAEELGIYPNVILAGRSTNDSMAKYVAELAIKGLNTASKVIKGSKVLLLGLTFKEDVRDARNSKAKDIIKELKEYGVDVFGYEPNIDDDKIKSSFKVEPLTYEQINKMDAVIVVNKHKIFKNITLDDLKKKMNSNPVLVDVKYMFNEQEALSKGFIYKSL